MKHNWTQKCLGDLCQMKSGSFISADELDDSFEFPCFGGNGIRGRIQKYSHDGDFIIIGRVGALCGNVNQFNGKFYATEHAIVASPLTSFISKWLYYVLSNADLHRYAKGAAQPVISVGTLKTIEIYVPPISVQQQIVAELDKINGVIADCRELLLKLDTLAKSLFYDYFGDPVTNPKGWHTLPLKKLSTLITNGTTPKGGQAVYVDSGITFFRSQNVWRNRIIYDDIVYLDESTNAAMKGSMLKHNDILITKTGRINTENSSLGRSALFTGEDDTANINGHVYLVRLDGSIEPRFVLSILLTESYRDLIRKVCVGAIDKRQLNLTHIQQFPIILPPLEIQKNYVKSIEAIEKQKATVEETIKKMQTLLDSRMDYWFN